MYLGELNDEKQQQKKKITHLHGGEARKRQQVVGRVHADFCKHQNVELLVLLTKRIINHECKQTNYRTGGALLIKGYRCFALAATRRSASF